MSDQTETIKDSHALISVVIPVLNEQKHINAAIIDIRNSSDDGNYEIIVVDGDPEGSTVKAIKDKNVKTITAEMGRGAQMNAGAAEADGKILLFLHADTRLPQNGLRKIIEAIEDKKLAAGAFDLDIDSGSPALRWIIAVARARSRISRIPYGDQGIFLRKSYFDKIGGFKEIPLMEDVDLMQRIKKDGGRIKILRDRIRTSARRWKTEGVFYTTIRDLTLISLYYLGVSPHRLAKFYKVCNGDRTKEREILKQE
jgi:rSAM/selenodomain-associated transferase 2